MTRPILLTAATLAILLLASTLGAAVVTTPPAIDLTARFQENGVAVDRLQVFEVGGIVIIRGRTTDRAAAEHAGQVAHSLGYGRVANLVQIAKVADDALIQRRAERELTINRALDGCQFNVSSDQGVVMVEGRVRHELQKDVAIQLLRGIDGVRSVRAELQRF